MFDIPPGPDPGAASRAVPIDASAELIAFGFELGAVVLAVSYGVFFLHRSPSPLKTVVKTAPVALLAAASALVHAPLLLIVGLALSALGDAFLAGDPKRWLPFGLVSFLVGHLAYVALFALEAQAPGPAQIGLMGVCAVAAIGMLWWLWPDLGRLRPAVAAYVLAILAMVCASLALPGSRAPAPIGALLFFASDAILSLQLFKQRFQSRAGQWAVWSFYFLGQCLIAAGFYPGGFA